MTMLLGLLAGMSFTMNFELPLDDPSIEYEPTPIANFVIEPAAVAVSEPAPVNQSASTDAFRLTSDLPAEAPEDLIMEPIRKKKKKKKKKAVAPVTPAVSPKSSPQTQTPRATDDGVPSDTSLAALTVADLMPTANTVPVEMSVSVPVDIISAYGALMDGSAPSSAALPTRLPSRPTSSGSGPMDGPPAAVVAADLMAEVATTTASTAPIAVDAPEVQSNSDSTKLGAAGVQEDEARPGDPETAAPVPPPTSTEPEPQPELQPEPERALSVLVEPAIPPPAIAASEPAEAGAEPAARDASSPRVQHRRSASDTSTAVPLGSGASFFESFESPVLRTLPIHKTMADTPKSGSPKREHVRSLSEGFTPNTTAEGVDPIAELLARRAKLGLQPVIAEVAFGSATTALEGGEPNLTPDESQELLSPVIPAFDFSQMEKVLQRLGSGNASPSPEPTPPRTVSAGSDLPSATPPPPDQLGGGSHDAMGRGERTPTFPMAIPLSMSSVSWGSESSLCESPITPAPPITSARIRHMDTDQVDISPMMPPCAFLVAEPSATTIHHYVSHDRWDVGLMAMDECAELMTRCGDGDFVVCLDLDGAAKESVDELRWLFFCDRGSSLKFPIRRTGKWFIFEGKQFETVPHVIRQLHDNDVSILSPMGRLLVLKAAAHDSTAWYQTTSFGDAAGATDTTNMQASTPTAPAATEDLAGVSAWSAAAQQTPPVGAAEVFGRAAAEEAAAPVPQTGFVDRKHLPGGGGHAVVTQASEPPEREGEAATPVPQTGFVDSKLLPGGEEDEGQASGPEKDEFIIVDDHFEPSLPFKLEATEDDSVDDLLSEITTRVEIVRNSAQQNNQEMAQDPKVQQAIGELVDLRYRYQIAKEKLNADVDFIPAQQFGGALIEHNEHSLKVHPAFSVPELCDHCDLPIKTKLMHNPLKEMKPRAYRCVKCKYTIHRKCLPDTTRKCLCTQVLTAGLETNICPDHGLGAQEYKCSDCSAQIGFNQEMFAEARLCDYSGQYMCPDCHKREMTVVPARVIHNWDFRNRSVSQRAKETLAILHDRPTIDLQQCNPLLLNHVEEVLEFSRLRREIKQMTRFLKQCRFAGAEPKLLDALADRPYLYKTESMYSIRDLVELKDGSLLAAARHSHGACDQHIRKDCQLCSAKGSFCEYCKTDQIIFPFDVNVLQCKECRAVSHTSCVADGDAAGIQCPRCARIAKYSRRSFTGPPDGAGLVDSTSSEV